MPEDKIKAFLKAVDANSALQEKLEVADTPETVIAITKEAGFVISSAETVRAIVELSDDKYWSWL
jgi:predicted ribosomally synthesized peptide with nif11-like leader